MEDMERNKEMTKDFETVENTQCEKPDESKEKLFTQEEVNNIVKKRLYERKKEKEEYSEKEKDLEDREASISLRENKIRCHELVIEKGYPKELLEILDTSDPERFNEQAEKLAVTYKAEKQESEKVYPAARRNPIKSHSDTKPFPNAKHVPKQY